MDKKNGYEEDPRFAVATKESKIIWLFAILGPAVQVLCAELFGRGDGKSIPMLGGLPLWVCLAFFIVPIAYIIIMLFIVNTRFRDMPLDDYLDDEAVEEFLKGGDSK